jgi:hypothetical protein
MDVQCRRCPYYDKVKDKLQYGRIILGFCRLRQKHITDMTINKLQCKDRAVITLEKKETTDSAATNSDQASLSSP